MHFYVDRSLMTHIPPSTLDDLLTQLGAGPAEMRQYAGGQRPFTTMGARNAAQETILLAHPRPTPPPQMSVQEAARRSGPANEAWDWA